MSIPCFSKVKILTNAYEDKGVSMGNIGGIIEVHSDEAYEVEFSRDDGTTIDWFAVQLSEIEIIKTEVESLKSEIGSF